MAWPSTASAASITASLSVGWGWMLRPSSQASPWKSCVSAGSAISSVASLPTMCVPSMRPDLASETIFTNPAVSPWICARPSAVNGNLPTFTSWPLSRACFSVRPTDAICGCEYVHRVTRSCSMGIRRSPAMSSTAVIPSCEAACASRNPPVTSPIACTDSAVVRLHADLLQADLLGSRRAAHRDEQLLRPDLALVGVDAHAVARLLGALDLGARPAVDARLLERAEHLLRDVLVLQRHQPVERLEQRDLRAQLVVEGRELDADGAGADDDDRLGDRGGQRGVVRRDDELAVEIEAGERSDSRPGGDDHVLRLDLRGADLDGVPVAQAALAIDDLDLVLLHQVLDALVELSHHGVAPRRDAREVVADDLGLQAELGPARGDPVVQLRGLEQDLGRDAPDVQAGAAQLVRLDERDLQAELRGPDRRGVTAHPAAENRHVEIGARHPNLILGGLGGAPGLLEIAHAGVVRGPVDQRLPGDRVTVADHGSVVEGGLRFDRHDVRVDSAVRVQAGVAALRGQRVEVRDLPFHQHRPGDAEAQQQHRAVEAGEEDAGGQDRPPPAAPREPAGGF